MLRRPRRDHDEAAAQAARANVYGVNSRIVIEGLSYRPDWGADTTTTCIRVLEDSTADDAEVGSTLLEVLARYNRDEQRSDVELLLKAAGLTSWTRLTQQAAFIPVEQHRERVEFSPHRRRPPSGWVRNAEDPVLEEITTDPGRLGRVLREALHLAEALPSGG